MAQATPKSPYKVVPLPAGYRRALPNEITPKVQRAAVRALQQCLPIGKLQATEVDDKLYCFVTEGHYDDHVTKPGKPIWHPGISTLVPVTQPAKVASQDLRDASFISQSRMTGESTFEGESVWAQLKKWWNGGSPTKIGDDVGDDVGDVGGVKRLSLPERKARAQALQQKMAAKRRAAIAADDDVNFIGDFGDDPYEDDLESTYAADELYDAVSGDDFGGDDFGDEFGAAKRKGKTKAKAKAKVQVRAKVRVKGKVTLGAKKKPNRPAPRKAAARPAPRKAAARPTPRKAITRPAPSKAVAKPITPPRTTATKTDSPLGPSAPFDETMMAPASNDGFAPEPMETEAPEQMEAEAPEQMDASPEVEAAMDDYEAEGEEETPETADEGSDTYDETAINGENFTHAKYSIGA